MSQSDVPGGIPGAGMPGAGMPGQGQPQQQVSEEEMRQYLGQMRAAPADAILAEVIQSLLSVAQVKLGRKDGRLLLDVLGGINDAARDRIDANLVQQVDDALSQLRVAQVEAEGEVTKAATEEGHVEHNDLDDLGRARAKAQQEAAQEEAGDAEQPQQAPPQTPPQQGSAGSRLWTPGG